jgi:hypothetical protein
VGTTDQGQAGDSKQTKQQAMQHAHLSMGNAKVASSITSDAMR